jgi:hypothetical protein
MFFPSAMDLLSTSLSLSSVGYFPVPIAKPNKALQANPAGRGLAELPGVRPFAMRVLILWFLLVALAGAADPAPWPNPAKIKAGFTDTPPNKLPRGLDFDQLTVEGHEPHTVGICWLDLNRDGTPELLVDSHEGGTGGSYKHIFAKTRSGFRHIAGWQGGVQFLTSANGYYQFESWSSGGGGEFSTALFRFERGRYRCVRLEDWRTKPGEDEPSFAASRNPKEYEN